MRQCRSRTSTHLASASASRRRSSSTGSVDTRTTTFRALVADCDTTLLVVARFLALLELYRDGSVAFDQVSPLGELHVRWTGAEDGEVVVRAEEYEGAPEPASQADGDGRKDDETGESDSNEVPEPADEPPTTPDGTAQPTAHDPEEPA